MRSTRALRSTRRIDSPPNSREPSPSPPPTQRRGNKRRTAGEHVENDAKRPKTEEEMNQLIKGILADVRKQQKDDKVKKVNPKTPRPQGNDHTYSKPEHMEKKEIYSNPAPVKKEIRLHPEFLSHLKWFEYGLNVTSYGDIYATVRHGALFDLLLKPSILSLLTSQHEKLVSSGLLLSKPPVAPPLVPNQGAYVFIIDGTVFSDTKQLSKDGMSPWHADGIRPKSKRVPVEIPGSLEEFFLVEYSARLPRERRLRKKVYYILDSKNHLYGDCMVVYNYETEGQIPEIFSDGPIRRPVASSRKGPGSLKSSSSSSSSSTSSVTSRAVSPEVQRIQDQKTQIQDQRIQDQKTQAPPLPPPENYRTTSPTPLDLLNQAYNTPNGYEGQYEQFERVDYPESHAHQGLYKWPNATWYHEMPFYYGITYYYV